MAYADDSGVSFGPHFSSPFRADEEKYELVEVKIVYVRSNWLKRFWDKLWEWIE